MVKSAVKSANLGFPRIGAFRELKKAVEAYWKAKITQDELQAEAANIRKTNWQLQQQAGLDAIPSNDFSFYDQVLDMSCVLGNVPARYEHNGGNVSLDTYFAMARGNQSNGQDVVAMEMTKWFDTNYHYIVPEFRNGTEYRLSSTKPVDQYIEAKQQGVETRPVIIGPVTYLLLGKSYDDGLQPLSLLNQILPIYTELLTKLKDVGATEVQIDEPYLVMDLDDDAREAYKAAYSQLSGIIDITIATYFGDLRDNLQLATSLPVKGLHVDLVRGANQLGDILTNIGDKELSVGVVDGRNIWKNNYENSLTQINQAIEAVGADKVTVAPSCSLLHTPVDLANEPELDTEIKNWFAYATQKLNEVATLTSIANGNAHDAELADNKAAHQSRATSSKIHDDAVKQRVANITAADAERNSEFKFRIPSQAANLNLPPLPTTTIGSFPQTMEIRAARRKLKKGELSQADYDKYIAEKTEEVIRFQEEIDIDVPVHGEYERNDMVEYFGEQLKGYVFSANGWVQSYGSRCVKPPVIFGDVSRPEAMTVEWTKYAQELTERPVKGMLTGPITMLQWSFVRDDQPRETTCKQIAFAIRDEVEDLEAAGIKLIQIDEPAIREGLPLRQSDWAHYLAWAVESFKISAAVVRDETQIHTHMCYSEFNDIIDSVAALDADVISIETSRSAMELLDAFVDYKYPNEIGPGVYDIHSPRIPSVNEMEHLLDKALDVIDARQVWVNPDCGLKTRGWDEVRPALENMVKAAKNTREKLQEQAA